MDLRAITDLEGGRLHSDAGSPNDPWDPGVPVAQRQPHTSAPAPPAASADGPTRHKDRREVMYRVPRSKHSDADRHVRTSDEDECEDVNVIPFVPRHASPDPRSHHPSDLHAAHMSGLHAASRAVHIAAHPAYGVNSDRDPDMGVSTTSTRTQMSRRRARPKDDNNDDDDGVEERDRYRSRPRRLSVEPGLSLKHGPPHSPPRPPPRRRSPPSALSPNSDSASSQPPTITKRPSDSNPRCYPDANVDRDGLGHPQRSDETEKQQLPTRGEYHLSEAQFAHPEIRGLARARSSSIESTDEWDQIPAPSQPPPHIAQKKMSAPSDSPVSVPASQSAPEAGSMLSDSELADETVHLRALLGCAPGAPVGLNALADPPPGEKPNYPLPTLIKLAIYGSPRRRLTLQEIYQALEDRFEWFRQRTDELSWKNSIRHNLSLRKCFLKVQRPITEPGKGSYWMIDLTQGEGNKRVRKRNKKPTKGQLAAQAAAEAYRASARLPGQGDGLRPTPYPMPSHTSTQSQIVEECSRGEMYQAPPMQTNFTTVVPPEEPHHSLLRSSSSQHAQSPGISPRQRQRPEQPYQLTSADHAPMTIHQNAAQSLPSSHDFLSPEANIDPSLRLPSKDGFGSHVVVGPIPASHHDILSQRGGPMPSMQPGTVQLPMPLNTLPISVVPLPRGQPVANASQIQQQPASANPQVQLTLPHPSLASSRPTYHHQVLSHQGTGPNTHSTVSTPHMSQHSPLPAFRHQDLQSTPALSHLDASRQMAATQQQPAFTHAEAQAPRLPPMRTLSESPAPATSSLQQPTSSLGRNIGGQTHQRQSQDPPTPTGFGRFAARPRAGFAKPTFGKPSLVGDPPPPIGMPVRPLLLSEDKGKRCAEGEGGDRLGEDERWVGAAGGNRRHFIPPSPRQGIEYVQRADGGLITARRTSGRHDQCTVEWIGRLDHGDETRNVDTGPPAPVEDMG